MSLIHKALKKAQGRIELPEEIHSHEFAGRTRSALTPRIMVLAVILILSLVLMIYKLAHLPPSFHKTASPPATVLTAPASLPIPGPPVQIGTLIKEGEALYLQGEYDQAITKLLEALSFVPNDAQILNNIGLIHKKKGNFKDAENYYKQALALQPNYQECLNNLGVLKDSTNDVLEASIYFKKAISLKPDYADPYFNLAVLNERQGNLEEAVKNYKQFLNYTSNGVLINKVKGRIEAIMERQ